MPGDGVDVAPVAHRRIVRREQQQDLGLQRIRVLELVDEQVGEALLQIGADALVLEDQIARAQEQVDEVGPAERAFGALIALDRRLQLVAQQRRQIRIGVTLEGQQRRDEASAWRAITASRATRPGAYSRCPALERVR